MAAGPIPPREKIWLQDLYPPAGEERDSGERTMGVVLKKIDVSQEKISLQDLYPHERSMQRDFGDSTMGCLFVRRRRLKVRMALIQPSGASSPSSPVIAADRR